LTAAPAAALRLVKVNVELAWELGIDAYMLKRGDPGREPRGPGAEPVALAYAGLFDHFRLKLAATDAPAWS